MAETFFPDLVGNTLLAARLTGDVKENMLSHAYILEGPHGSGRHTVARSTVAALACERLRDETAPRVPCGKCKYCEKILGDKTPDVITAGLEDDKSTIGVDAVRALKNAMYTAPIELPVKVFLIEDADRMTSQAQNAFLLSLEEPPAYVLFFLICENAANLLETVRSRAPALRTERIPAEELESYLLSHDKRAKALKEESEEDWLQVLRESDGCIGYGLELLNASKRKQVLEYRRVAKNLISLLARPGRAAALDTLAAFGSKRQDVSRQLPFLQKGLRDLLLLKKSEAAPLCFFEDRDSALELSTHFTAQTLFALYDASTEAADELDAGANVRLALMHMLQRAGLLE